MKAFYTSVVASLVTFVGAIGLCFSSAAMAAPWIDASDIYLRADIQALADVGAITVPVNTFPLMWSGIGADLAKVEPETLSPSVAQAFARVNFYYRNAVANRGNASIKAVAASDAARFRHFGSDSREQGELKGSYEYLGGNFAFKAAASGNFDPEDDRNFRIDDSYLAAILGNWVVSAGALEQWWGPGFDSALHKSTNARPMPSLMLSRNNAAGFETPWLSWIGPWTLTTGVGVFEKERYAPHALLWNVRGTLRPLRQLEVGFSWTVQFCGEGQECDGSTAIKAITGAKDCRNDTGAGCTNYGNQLAGFDFRYADTFFEVPLGIYFEKTCEDSESKLPWQITDCGYLWGADTRFDFAQQQIKLFMEYTDTIVSCGGPAGKGIFDCFYEHSTYQSGSRHYGRALGSTYDSDAEVYALGLVGQFADSQGFTSILRYAKLNKDGRNRSSLWAPQPLKEDILMLELSYRLPLWKGMASLGGTLSESDFVTQDTKTHASLFGTYEYRF
ncbi:capsule assembly Wzi family protein [Shewanella salipaludis]|uniref:Capsule assembly Wzi family protein n=1 Tax=Shewanella salipaludis TaxID=2723052 RepID=A0A972G394_9GAMM|nr:capsule assembly Wzi family protein [Shewanella salipaludis]NMH66691.1 capsule assembly Wzi family protein [Shewanella salipaludis]